jgi:hypothetical protein
VPTSRNRRCLCNPPVSVRRWNTLSHDLTNWCRCKAPSENRPHRKQAAARASPSWPVRPVQSASRSARNPFARSRNPIALCVMLNINDSPSTSSVQQSTRSRRPYSSPLPFPETYPVTPTIHSLKDEAKFDKENIPPPLWAVIYDCADAGKHTDPDTQREPRNATERPALAALHGFDDNGEMVEKSVRNRSNDADRVSLGDDRDFQQTKHRTRGANMCPVSAPSERPPLTDITPRRKRSAKVSSAQPIPNTGRKDNGWGSGFGPSLRFSMR